MMLCLMSAGPAEATQTLFKGPADYPTGSSPRSVAVADVNGDGRPDIVTANINASSVSVLLGKGDGTYQAKTDYPTGSSPISVAVADVNADGTPDLVTANANADTVSVLLGVAPSAAGLTPSQRDFGVQAQGTLGASREFTLSSTGGQPVTVGRALISGVDQDDFIITTDTCSGQDIAVGASCIVRVRFAPSAPGARNATLTVTDDAPSSPQQSTLTGTGGDLPQGATGPAGPAGTNGTNGSNGATGPAGTNGSNGSNGATGPAGTNGSNGATGPAGAAGSNGLNGSDGAVVSSVITTSPIVLRTRNARLSRSASINLRITCPAALSATGTLKLRAVDGAHITLGISAISCPAGKARMVTIALTAKARRNLARGNRKRHLMAYLTTRTGVTTRLLNTRAAITLTIARKVQQQLR